MILVNRRAVFWLFIYFLWAFLLTGCVVIDDFQDTEVSSKPVMGESSGGAVDVTADQKEAPKLEEENNSVETVEPEEKPPEHIQAQPELSTEAGIKTEFFADTLLIGDSRTEGFMLYAGVNNATYFCGKGLTVDEIIDGKQFNINGNKISIYDALDKQSYGKVYISIGMNELGWNYIDVFKEKYKSLIDLVREKQPEAEIFLQAVLPVTMERSDKDKVNNNPQIYWYNLNIIEVAAEKGVLYVNAASAVVDSSGYLDPAATTDGIHLNRQFCERWADYLVSKPRGEEV